MSRKTLKSSKSSKSRRTLKSRKSNKIFLKKINFCNDNTCMSKKYKIAYRPTRRFYL